MSDKGRTLLPVVGPLVALLALTGLSRASQLITSAGKTNSSLQARLGTVALNETEDTFARYNEVATLLQHGKTGEALLRIGDLRNTKITVDTGAFVHQELKPFSPTTLMMRLGRALTTEAKQAAESGDAVTAQRFANACRVIAEHVLDTSDPTLEALNLAHYFDLQAATLDAEIYARVGNGGAAEAARNRFDALMQLWKSEMLPQIMQAREMAWNNGKHDHLAASTPSPRQRAFVARMSSEYQARRASLFGIA
jgi:hypothetical protein